VCFHLNSIPTPSNITQRKIPYSHFYIFCNRTKNLDFLNFLTNKNLELYIQDLNNFINNSNKDQKCIEILNSLYSRLIEKLIDKNIINFNIKRA
jgi:hypothetical protein